MPFMRKKRKQRNWFWNIVGLMAAVLAVAVFSYFWFGQKVIERSSGKIDLTPNRANILVMGVDERKDDIGRSDTMFVVTVDTDTQHVSLLSIPRDTRVKIPSRGWDKINHSYGYGGRELSQKAVEDLLGIDIDYYVIVDFAGFSRVVDAIGGVDINIEKRMLYEDPYDDLVIDLYPGPKHLDGRKAIQYVRYRDEDGDIGRVRRQQRFIQAALDKVFSPSGLIRLPALIREVSSSVKTDLPTPQMLGLARKLSVASQNGLKTDVVPGTSAYIRDISYWLPDIVALREHVANIQNIAVTNEYLSRAQSLADEYTRSIPPKMEIPALPKIKTVKPADKKTTQPPDPKKPKVTVKVAKQLKVEILNGSGIANAGQKIAAIFKEKQFAIAGIRNVPLAPRTVVTSYSTNSNIINKLTALPFAYALQITKDDSRDVVITVTIGKDYASR